jgi:exopolyphosphatase/guanosine-5'-triphosphate,3'-diphosphate pyrophosphatase
LLKVNYEERQPTLRKIGAPESYAQSLLSGKCIEEIIQKDKDRINDTEINCASIRRTCADIASKYWPDTKHSEQVRKISLDLFDALKDLHKLGKREQCWLECAAILHDIGLSKGSSGHHKNTLRLILNETQLPFTSTERQAIANICRYHRKELPKNNHEYFGSLSREVKKQVRMLSSILRLADGLDVSHQSNVQSVETSVDLNIITVHATFNRNPILEEQEFSKKKDLFEKVFTKKIVLAWKNSPNADNINGSLKISVVLQKLTR